MLAGLPEPVPPTPPLPRRVSCPAGSSACVPSGVPLARRLSSTARSPGEYFVHSEDLVITTTLGSCIAACLWDRQAAVGGINHFMLPGDGASDDGGRYGSCAMELLINALIKRGATRRTLEAKVFGGAALIAGNGALNVGQRNTSFVLDYLRTEEIPLVSQDVLGPYPRKVCFFPKTGRAMVRRLPPAQREAAIALDQDARRRASASAAGSIDLF